LRNLKPGIAKIQGLKCQTPRNKIFPAACRIPVWPFVVVVKGGQRAGLDILSRTLFQGEDMPQYLVTIQLPDNFDPSTMTEATIRNIEALNQEMDAAGVTKFAGGLMPASMAKSLRNQPDGTVSITDGPYVEAKEHIGGISILECADMDEALAWARKGAIACRASGEVREIFFRPPDNGQA
jgi:hypothetical protein